MNLPRYWTRMQQNHQWNDCFNFHILRRVCIKGGRGGGGGNTWTILSWSMIWFGVVCLFVFVIFLPVCVFVTIFSVLLWFLFNLFCTVLCSCSCCFLFPIRKWNRKRRKETLSHQQMKYLFWFLICLIWFNLDKVFV